MTLSEFTVFLFHFHQCISQPQTTFRFCITAGEIVCDEKVRGKRWRESGDCPSGRCGIISDEEKAAAAATERLQSFVMSRCFTVCVCVCVRERARPRFSLRGNSQDSH